MSNSFTYVTDLTTVLANIATIDTVVDAIRAVDVPAITADIAALPQTNAGIQDNDFATVNLDAWTQVSLVTGAGKIICCGFYTDQVATQDFVRITLDGGVAYVVPTNALAAGSWTLINGRGGEIDFNQKVMPIASNAIDGSHYLGIDFKVSALLEAKAPVAGPAGNTRIGWSWNLY